MVSEFGNSPPIYAGCLLMRPDIGPSVEEQLGDLRVPAFRNCLQCHPPFSISWFGIGVGPSVEQQLDDLQVPALRSRL